ncbi:MAG: carbohydrate ABC transporter permease [Acetatifactor sp.]|nr:carbohydrate ABC transporter permease [Acetatifactor sp.]
MKVKESLSDKALQVFAYIFIGLIGVACFYPLLMTLSVSFSSEKTIALKGYSAIPQDFSLDTYIYIFGNSGKELMGSYGVTVSVTVIGTCLALLITSMLAFAVSISDLKYRNVLSFICNFTIIFGAGLIPWYYVCVNYYHLKDSMFGLIVPSMFSVWNMFLLRTYFKAISQSLYEAARIDGANYFQIYAKIAMPLSKTPLLTVGLMYALQYWNDWWNALMFVSDKKLWPLQYFLYNILSNVNAISSGRVPAGAAANIQLPSETVKMAVTILTIGPIIFAYPFIQKYFVSGVMTGAVKE